MSGTRKGSKGPGWEPWSNRHERQQPAPDYDKVPESCRCDGCRLMFDDTQVSGLIDEMDTGPWLCKECWIIRRCGVCECGAKSEVGDGFCDACWQTIVDGLQLDVVDGEDRT